MALQILSSAGEALENSLALSENAATQTRNLSIVNTGPERLLSLKAYVGGDTTLPAERAVTIGGVAVTGTSEADATELLSGPLEPGAALSGTEVFSLSGPLEPGYEPLTLSLIGLPEV